MWKNKSISVIIPCFNEGKNIRKNVLSIFQYLQNKFSNFEIIAVNDGSGDNTKEELLALQKEIPLIFIDNEKNQGKGGAVKVGMLNSKNDIVMFLDADLAIPIESLETFIPEIEKGFEVVIASRFVPGLKVLKPVLWYRKCMEKVFRLLRMIVLNNYIVKDTQCGFKVFTREAAMKIFPLLTINRFAFDSEIIYLATKYKFRIKELPISLQNPISSSVRIFSDPVNMMFDLIRIRINNLMGRYK